MKNQYFIFGDIHGDSEKLLHVLEKVMPIASNNDYFIFLGDYVDRGPDSKGVIEILLSLSRKKENCIFLKGNHEDMLLDYLGMEGNHGESFLMNGGRETIHSYQGVKKIPFEHIMFFKNCRKYFLCPDYPYLFVHAGIKPGIPLKEQDPLDLFWIRAPFIGYNGKWQEFDKVIYGHTPTSNRYPRFEENKIGIDTGVAYGGPLTVLQIPDEKIIAQE